MAKVKTTEEIKQQAAKRKRLRTVTKADFVLLDFNVIKIIYDIKKNMFLVPRSMYYSLFCYADAYCKSGITQMYNLKKVFQCITNPVIKHFVYNYGYRKLNTKLIQI
jgi:hypothetical protein